MAKQKDTIWHPKSQALVVCPGGEALGAKTWNQREACNTMEARAHGVLLRQEARKKNIAIVSSSSPSCAVAISQSFGTQSATRRHVSAPSQTVGQTFDPWADLRAPIEAVLDASLDPELVMALQLGLDEQTFRQLRALERREIRPEDYDLLGHLDESIKPSTLSGKHLKLFPTESYRAATLTMQYSSPDTADIGVDFWHLPLPPLEDATQVSTSVEEPEVSMLVEESMPAEVCGVCLVDFEDGDELRRLLPCGHRFHRECIDRWLLEASTTCPVDNLDLRCEC